MSRILPEFWASDTPRTRRGSFGKWHNVHFSKFWASDNHEMMTVSTWAVGQSLTRVQVRQLLKYKYSPSSKGRKNYDQLVVSRCKGQRHALPNHHVKRQRRRTHALPLTARECSIHCATCPAVFKLSAGWREGAAFLPEKQFRGARTVGLWQLSPLCFPSLEGGRSCKFTSYILCA